MIDRVPGVDKYVGLGALERRRVGGTHQKIYKTSNSITFIRGCYGSPYGSAILATAQNFASL